MSFLLLVFESVQLLMRDIVQIMSQKKLFTAAAAVLW